LCPWASSGSGSAGLVWVYLGTACRAWGCVFTNQGLGDRGHRPDMDPFGQHPMGCHRRDLDHRRPCRAGRPLQEPSMRDDRGSTTIWMLGLSVLLLLFGGLALDFWRGLAFQRELAAVADSAAIAAASGIDEVHFRETGEIRLDPARAVGLA